MQRKLIGLALVAPILSLPALAETTPDWTYIEVSYVDTDDFKLDASNSSTVAEDFEGDIEGLEVEGSWLFHDWAYGRVSYSNQNEDFIFSDLELKVRSVGLGGVWQLNETTDLYAEVSFEKWDAESFTFTSDPNGGFGVATAVDLDDNGYRLAGGARAIVWRGLELNVEAGYLDVGDVVDGEGFFELGAIYTFNNGFGLGTSFEKIDDLESWRFTLRYAFR